MKPNRTDSKCQFIAVILSDAARARLLALRKELRTHAVSGDFDLPGSPHLELVNLGECSAKQMIAAKQAVNAVPFEPFPITISGGGYLDKGRPNPVFCDVQNDSGGNRLRKLRSDLLESLSVKGFRLDEGKFRPQVMLGREVVWKNSDGFSSYRDIRFARMEERVTGIGLMKLEQIGGQATCVCLFEKKWRDGERCKPIS